MKAFANIDTVHGMCEHCNEDSILVAIVSEFYRCTNCGADTRQHINGSIRYIQLSESDKEWLKNLKTMLQEINLKKEVLASTRKTRINTRKDSKDNVVTKAKVRVDNYHLIS